MSHDNHSPLETEGKSMSWPLVLVLLTLGALGLYLFSAFILDKIDAGWVERRKTAEAISSQNEAQVAALAPATAAEEAAPAEGAVAAAAAVDGKAVYERTCGACHQPTGLGIPGAFPPLTQSDYVTGDPLITTHIVLKGLAGEITVGGQTFNGQMPAWEKVLSDAEIAAVVTYIRSSWGNSAGAVDAATVAAERAKLSSRSKPFTAKELK